MPAAETPLVIVGLGLHGQEIAEGVVDRGYPLVGAVEVDARAGHALDRFIPGAAPRAVVHGTVTGSLAARPRVAILSPSVALPAVLDMARDYLAAGVNVLSLAAEAFDPEQGWRAELDRIGRETGATFLATGVQDTWWVHLPAVAAGSSSRISRLRIEHVVDVNSLSVEVGRLLGVGELMGEDAIGAEEAYQPGSEGAVLAPALVEAARRVGLQPTGATVRAHAVGTDVPVWWVPGGRELPVGTRVGVEEHVTVGNDRGVSVEGLLRTVILPEGADPYDRLTIDGDPQLVLDHRPFPGDRVTNVAVLNRIPDVVSARGGVVAASELPPANTWLG